jgi:hypothetical protein
MLQNNASVHARNRSSLIVLHIAVYHYPFTSTLGISKGESKSGHNQGSLMHLEPCQAPVIIGGSIYHHFSQRTIHLEDCDLEDASYCTYGYYDLRTSTPG